MYFLLILFFASLLGITFMIGRKLLMLQNGQILHKETFLKAPDLEEWKYVMIKNIKKYGYISLVVTIRFYVRSSNLLNSKYKEIKLGLQEKLKRNRGDQSKETKEVSKFLKMMSEYKHKIRKIKEKVKEEENL